MKEVQLRLLSFPAVPREDTAAVAKAARGFETYGVKHDIMMADRSSFASVKYGSFVRDVLTRPDTHLVSDLNGEKPLQGKRPGDILLGALFPKDILGVGITPLRLFTRENGSRRELMGTGRFNTCAFVSTSITDNYLAAQKSLPPKERIIELLARHEMGHLLMDRTGHCEDDSCIMRANKKDERRFLDTVARGLDFCKECQAALSRGISMIRYGTAGQGACIFEDV
jgi:hypothetical protein